MLRSIRQTAVVLAALALASGVAACGSDNSAGSSSGGGGEATSSGKSGKDVKVRVITVTPTTAGTWDPNQAATYKALATEKGWDLQIAEAVPYGEAEKVLDQWAKEGVDVVFSTDNGFEDSLLAAAEQNPDTAWVMMSALSTTKGLKNVAAYNFDWCQFGYLQGVVGGLVSKSGKMGTVGPIDILPVQQTVAAQEIGGKTVNPSFQVLHKNTGDFTDVQKAQAVTSGLVGSGADAITGAAQGGISPQIAARAQSEKASYIGSYGDETKFAPDATVANVIADFRGGYESAVQGWLDGNLSAEIHTEGAKEGTIKVTPLKGGFEDKQAQVDQAVKDLSDGKVQWPSDGPCAQK